MCEIVEVIDSNVKTTDIDMLDKMIDVVSYN